MSLHALLLSRVAAFVPDENAHALELTCVQLRCAALKVAVGRRRLRLVAVDAAYMNPLRDLLRQSIIRAGTTLVLQEELTQPGAIVTGCTALPRFTVVDRWCDDREEDYALLRFTVVCEDEAQLCTLLGPSSAYQSVWDTDEWAPAPASATAVPGVDYLWVDCEHLGLRKGCLSDYGFSEGARFFLGDKGTVPSRASGHPP